jgi:hypothetical protein
MFPHALISLIRSPAAQHQQGPSKWRLSAWQN